jgi:hypothetical protein
MMVHCMNVRLGPMDGIQHITVFSSGFFLPVHGLIDWDVGSSEIAALGKFS